MSKILIDRAVVEEVIATIEDSGEMMLAAIVERQDRAVETLRAALAESVEEPAAATVVARHYIDGTRAGNALNWNSRNGEDDFPVGTKLYTAPAKRDLVPFGWVTVRWLSKKYKDHVDQYQFYPWGQSPYLDNVDQCYTVYLKPNSEDYSAVEDPCRYPDCVDQGPDGRCVRWLMDSCSRGVVDE